MASVEDERPVLFMWLNLLGWRVELADDGEFVAGVASHCAVDGEPLRVCACTGTREELALQLFEGAMKTIESRGPHHLRRPLAA